MSELGPPDPGFPCCMAAIIDPTDCTCWRPMIVPHPTQAVQAGPAPVRRSRCGDCAYRRDSRERREMEGDPPHFYPDHTFYCHAGLPRVWAWVHPSGAVRLTPRHPDTDDYRPILRNGTVWQADGRPGIVCAGWAADKRAYEERPNR